MFKKPTSNKSSCLAVALCVTKLMNINVMNGVTLKSDLDVQQTCLEQKLMLSCSFMCDQINEHQCYELGHT
jgi:hypothetical protein